MTNRNTKRALLVSVMAMLLCVSMLVGTTFAWFTDTEATGKNIIKSGNLDVELSYFRPDDSTAPADFDTITWKDVDGSTEVFDKDALWEPGYTQVVYFKVENKGSLALKYNMAENIYTEKSGVNMAGEEFKLSDYLYSYVAMNEDAATIEAIDTREAAVNLATNELGDSRVDDLTLLAGETKYGVMIVTMPTTVGNEANHMTAEAGEPADKYQPEIGLGISLVATQKMYEDDSFGTDYDEDATYPEYTVSTADDFAAALAEGGVITLNADIALDEVLTVNGNVVVDLNGYNLTSNTATVGRPLEMADNSSIFINAADNDFAYGAYGLVNIPAGTTNVSVTVNGGNFTGAADNGAFIKVRPGADNIDITLTNVTMIDNGSADSFILNANETDVDSYTLTVNGGTFECGAGFQVYGDATINGATIKTKGLAFEVTGGNATITNCTIVVDPGTQVANAPATAIAASNGGYALVENCDITATTAFYVYSSGGDIVANNNTGVATWKIDYVGSTITIDGVVNTKA